MQIGLLKRQTQESDRGALIRAAGVTSPACFRQSGYMTSRQPEAGVRGNRYVLTCLPAEEEKKEKTRMLHIMQFPMM